MEKRIRTLSFVFAFLMAITVFGTNAQPAYAASVDTSVVSQITFKDADSIDCVKYKYNKKGLVKRKENYHDDVLNSSVNYIYDSDGLLTCAVLRTGGKKILKATYRYNSNNQLIKRVSSSYTDDSVITVKYTYKNGMLSKSVTTYKGVGSYEDGATNTELYTFDSNGFLIRKTSKHTGDKKLSGTFTYTHDGFGIVKKYSYKTGYTDGYIKRALTYKKNLLRKYQDTGCSKGKSYTVTPALITWDTLSVPKSKTKAVTAQQQEIINGDYGTNLCLGYDYYRKG